MLYVILTCCIVPAISDFKLLEACLHNNYLISISIQVICYVTVAYLLFYLLTYNYLCVLSNYVSAVMRKHIISE